MKKALLAILVGFWATSLSYSQSIPDFGKLSKACELWGLIKYFHPDKPGVEFDSAFAHHVPRMLAAGSEEEWEDVLFQWLGILDDPNTLVYLDHGKVFDEGTFYSEFTADSMLMVKISGNKPFEDLSKFNDFYETLLGQISQAKKGLIFDLRNEHPISQEYKGYLDYFIQALDLGTETVPQFKTLYYSGFRPESDYSSGKYSENVIIRNSIEPGDFHQQGLQTAWIVNRYTEMPMTALSHQASGIGFILSDTAYTAGLLPLSGTYHLSEKLTAKFKTKGVVSHSGVGLLADHVYRKDEDPRVIARDFLSDSVKRERVSTGSASQMPKRSDVGSYPDEEYPAVGYRVLAAAKIFTVIETFFPYHEYMDRNWKEVFVESLPDFVNAGDEIEYGLAVAKFYANINDSHGSIYGNKGVNKLLGEAPSPVKVDWIADQVVVTAFRSDSICNANGLEIGDVVTKVNGVTFEDYLANYKKYFAHSNAGYMTQQAAERFVRGPKDGEAVFTILDNNGRYSNKRFTWSNSYNKGYKEFHRLDTITLLSKDIGYADLTRMEEAQTDQMFEKFKETKAIIFDMRGYPNGTAWSIAPRLVEVEDVPLALFRKPEILSPSIKEGDYLANRSYTEFTQTISPSHQWKYKGKTVMLINHKGISQSEHTGLFFEAVNNTVFIGSPTAGANGDVTRFEIPGGISLSFSGQGVWHADGRQLQRKGLQPHVLVTETREGIRNGKDEVLDKALEWISENVK
ncbi:C-terminal processing protease CtpA/Prc [Algoriphagus sp. 4150]|uniref:S41 family peptidase n=1 Tax=Algoriphagus sp. 4150 TaxID=2817756 RepID=UPI0028621264|nr:S41 family peptidase [Algoriphagus sp. 4150]MDR7132641.1 C-terminal processing protease CtpA/Prc [Algoriphagus sp. 4150]